MSNIHWLTLCIICLQPPHTDLPEVAPLSPIPLSDLCQDSLNVITINVFLILAQFEICCYCSPDNWPIT